MRKIIVHEFMTLDGVIQAPGSATEDIDGGFQQGGWVLPYWHDDIGEHFSTLMDRSDTLLLGRKTWQTHGEAFEKMPVGDPFGDAMKKIRKIVVSTTLKSADMWRNSTIIDSDVVRRVSELKNMPGKDILIDGSSVLIPTLIENGLVDEFHLNIYPLIVGKGKRLFSGTTRQNLKLVQSKTLPTGVVFQEYVLDK